jgi:hypothetical protein
VFNYFLVLFLIQRFEKYSVLALRGPDNRVAGFSPIGIGGGNIIDSGTKSLCTHYEENFEQILTRLR